MSQAVDIAWILGESKTGFEFVYDLNSEVSVFFLRGLYGYILRGIVPIEGNI